MTPVPPDTASAEGQSYPELQEVVFLGRSPAGPDEGSILPSFGSVLNLFGGKTDDSASRAVPLHSK